MNKRKLGVALAFTAGLAAIVPASAVTVDIDIRTEGEPVPGTTISFETPDGKEIPPQEQTATEVPPAEEQTPKAETPSITTAEQGEPKVADEPDVAEVPYTPFRAELPDGFSGQEIVIVVRKGDELIKREQTRLDPETPKVDIEAYDPADANLAVETSQPKICRRGRGCKQQVSITNNGNGIYKGPVFLTSTMHGLPDNSIDQEDKWFCGYVGRGKQLCQNAVSLQPGETAKWDVKVRLNRQISQRASSCVGISRLDDEPAGRSDPVLQAIQLGLARRHINPGRPDGITGPRTQAAIGQYLEQQGMPSTSTLQQLFQSLYGITPTRLARLGVPEEENCTRLSLVKEKPKVSKKKKRKRRSRQEFVEEEIFEDEEFEEPTVRVRIGVGLGGGVNRGHRTERRHDRRKRRRRWQD